MTKKIGISRFISQFYVHERIKIQEDFSSVRGKKFSCFEKFSLDQNFLKVYKISHQMIIRISLIAQHNTKIDININLDVDIS